MNARILSGVLIAAACAAGAGAIVGVTAHAWAAPPRSTPAGSVVPAAPPVAPPSGLLPGGELGELLSTFVPRDPRDLQRLLLDARQSQAGADGEIDGAKRLAMDAEGRVRILRGELMTTRTRRDVARRTGDLAKQTEAEVIYRRQTREVAYLEKLRDTIREDAERATAERDAAVARIKALDLELQLAGARPELQRAGVSLITISRYRDQLWQVLEAQRAAADRARDASARVSRVAELRMRQVYALSQLGR